MFNTDSESPLEGRQFWRRLVAVTSSGSFFLGLGLPQECLSCKWLVLIAIQYSPSLTSDMSLTFLMSCCTTVMLTRDEDMWWKELLCQQVCMSSIVRKWLEVWTAIHRLSYYCTPLLPPYFELLTQLILCRDGPLNNPTNSWICVPLPFVGAPVCASFTESFEYAVIFWQERVVGCVKKL